MIRGWIAMGLTLCAAALLAQTITVSGEVNLRAEYVYDVFGEIEDQILLIRDGINEFDLQAFDRDLRQTWDREEKLETRKARIVEIVDTPDDFKVVYSDEHRDTLTIKVRTYDGKAKLQHLDTILIMKRGFVRPKFRFTRSENDHIFLMTELENERMIAAYCYDLQNRKLLWHSDFQFQDINFREEYRKTIVTNDGTMYVIFEKNNFRFRKDEHSVGIFRFDQERRQFDLQAIPLAEFTTYDAHFAFDNVNEHLILLGLYSDRNSGNTDGMYHIRIDHNNFQSKPPQVSLIDYSDELITDFYGKYKAKRESLSNLDIRDAILRQDGGILIIAEENKEYERLSYGARRDYYGSSRFSVDYYYEDIILLSINPDGTSHWQKLLPKRQYSNDDDAVYSSYFLFSNPSFLRILYNDEIRNENTVSEYILNAGGDITRRSLMSTDNQKLKLQIKNAVQIDNNALIIPSVRGRKLKLVKLTY